MSALVLLLFPEHTLVQCVVDNNTLNKTSIVACIDRLTWPGMLCPSVSLYTLVCQLLNINTSLEFPAVLFIICVPKVNVTDNIVNKQKYTSR